MKPTTAFGAMSLTLLLAGCGDVRTLTQVPAGCAASNSITVEYGPGRLEIDNECIDVAGGSSVALVFMPTPAVDTVHTKFRGFGNKWIDKANSDSNDPGTIRLPVPRGNGSRKSYKYEIHVDGVGMLDPRIVVQ